MTAPALWLLRYLTGYRPYHVIAFVLALTVSLGALAIPFWWLAEQAHGVAGPLAFVLLAVAYLYAAMLLLGVAAAVAVRLVLARLRRSIGPSRPSWR